MPSVTSVGSHHWRVIHSHFLVPVPVPKYCEWPSLGDRPPLGKSPLAPEAGMCKDRTDTLEQHGWSRGLWWS